MFDQMACHNTAHCSILICGFTSLFVQMLEEPMASDDYTFSFLLKVFSRPDATIENEEQAHELALNLGRLSWDLVRRSVINFYSSRSMMSCAHKESHLRRQPSGCRPLQLPEPQVPQPLREPTCGGAHTPCDGVHLS